MKFVKHTTDEVIEVYLLDDEGKILLTDSFPRIETMEPVINMPAGIQYQTNEDLLLELTVQKMIKMAVKKKLLPINEIDEVGVKTLKYVSKKAELEEDFK